MKAKARYFNGNYYVTFNKHTPYYSTQNGKDRYVCTLCKLFGYRLVLRKKNITELTPRGHKLISKTFYKVRGLDGITRFGDSYSLLDFPFFLNGDSWKCTVHYGVVYNETLEKWFGFTHRGAHFFGKGDILFDLLREDKDSYYDSDNYRKKYINALKRYDKSKDALGFKNLIDGGIVSIVPFKKRGSIVITTSDEARQAAIDFVTYLS